MNKFVVKVTSAVLAIVLVAVLSFSLAMSGSSEPVQAQAPQQAQITLIDPQNLGKAANCSVIQNPKSLKITCKVAGVVVLNQTIPLPQLPPITLPPVTLPGQPPITIRIPGETQTVRPPPVTKTVTPDGPTATVTDRVPNRTQTVTVTPGATSDVTPGGQDGGEGDTIEPEENDPIDFGDDDVTIQEVGLGTLAIFLLVGLVLLAMWGGYYIGYRDADRENADFMDALLTKTVRKRRGKHS